MPPARTHLLNRDDLIDHLKRQMAFLERSAQAFDDGAEDEAVRLATVVRVLDSSEGGSYVAPLGDLSPTRIRPNRPFDPWWIEPVTKDQAGALFSRKNYVLTASNKEGGTHVDHQLDAAYSALSKDNTLGWAYTLDEEASRPLDRNPAFASIRQIAYEVEQTIRQHPMKVGLHT